MRGLFTLLVVVAICVAFYLGWFKFTMQHDPNDDRTTELTLKVNKEKIKEDTEAARNKLKQTDEKAKDKVAALPVQNAKGKVVRVEEKQFTLTTADDKELTVQVNASTKLELKNATMSLKELRPGDQVIVTYTVIDGNNVAQHVSVERAA